MKTAPVMPATLSFDAHGVPHAAAFDDVYHARAGALAQARHVFLGGNGLPQRWRGARRFTVLETGFGLGNNFLATWDAWRADAQRCERLHYIGIEKHPLTHADLSRVHVDSPLRALADALVAQWPLPTPNLQRLAFDNGRVQLLLACFDVRDVLPELVAEVDAFYLDGFAPAKNPAMWEPRVLKALGRLAAPGASAATWSVAREVRNGLAQAGFMVEKAPGFENKREMSVARYAPRFTPRRAPARRHGHPPEHVAIVGAGLAGCALAWALAEQGIAGTLLERHAQPAGETSGNAAGVFHGIVTPHDGPHARFSRAAALQAERLLRHAVQHGGVTGEVEGLLRLSAHDDAGPLHALLGPLGLPGGYVHAVAAHEASELAGLPLHRAALFYPGGGWVEPSALARHFIAQAGSAVRWHGGSEVASLRRDGDAWQLLDARGVAIERTDCVVLANHADALRLLDAPDWPLQRVRGQTSGVPLDAPGLAAPRRPLAGFGYVTPATHGRVWCGATSDAGDASRELRREDHARNLEQLSRLLGQSVAVSPDALTGRVGWRLVADDRLPLIGGVPDAAALAAPGLRLDQPRFVPRMPGLFVFTALASRGITWATLGAQTLAALISGAPCPLESSLLDAVDAARFASRAARRTER
jgi:tRNA 5-methylaminomethyl-2-thiouridine biosynthesis bifunctional protein